MICSRGKVVGLVYLIYFYCLYHTFYYNGFYWLAIELGTKKPNVKYIFKASSKVCMILTFADYFCKLNISKLQ